MKLGKKLSIGALALGLAAATYVIKNYHSDILFELDNNAGLVEVKTTGVGGLEFTTYQCQIKGGNSKAGNFSSQSGVRLGNAGFASVNDYDKFLNKNFDYVCQNLIGEGYGTANYDNNGTVKLISRPGKGGPGLMP